MQHIYRNIFLFAVLGSLGCEHINSNYCEEAPHTNCKDLIDAPVDGPPTGCKATPAICTGATPACDMASDTCVECTTTSKDLCIGAEPVCGSDETCRGCTAHSECTSEVCLPDGSCAAAGDVAYVDGNVGAGTTCTQAAPCKTVTAAVAPSVGKAVVKVSGTVVETTRIVIGSPTVKAVLGAPGAKISGSTTMVILEARGGANVTFADLEIGSTMGFEASACVLLLPGETVTVRLLRSTIRKCTVGVNVLSGTAIIDQGTVTLNGLGIQQSSGGMVTVTGVTVAGNTGGGIQVTGNGGFKLVNNFIVSNGSGTSAVGGLQIANVTQAGTYECAFNTIYNNDVIPSAIAGVNCQTVVVPLAFKNNIVFANKVAAGGTQVGGSAMCQHTYSDIGPDTVAGTGNINVDPQFVNVAQTDVHLKATSPVKDVADPAATLTIDIDGDTRPQGGGRDLGADEYKP